VLIVDDDKRSLELATQSLSAAGHRVSTRTSTVGTAADVIALAPDVALIEVQMHGLRGDDLARLLKRHPATRGVAVILHSSMPFAELRTLIMTTGALGVIEKGSNAALFLYTFNQLTAKLRANARSFDLADSPPATSGTFRVESSVAADTSAAAATRATTGSAAKGRRG